MKYPIGIQTFEQIINNGFVYVDKTDMVYALATEGKTYFLSRPAVSERVCSFYPARLLRREKGTVQRAED